MQVLDLDRQALGSRLGYRNPLKGAGRVCALCEGYIMSAKSGAALNRLPQAIDVPAELVEQALAATEKMLADMDRQTEETLRLAREKEETEWRAAFRPHAIILTERTVPTQITICGLTGGAERWLMIRFDRSTPPLTYTRQALNAVAEKAPLQSDGNRHVSFFGAAIGLIVNYSPDRAVRHDLEGTPMEVLDKAYRPGEVRLWLGHKPVPLTTMARLLGTGSEHS